MSTMPRRRRPVGPDGTFLGLLERARRINRERDRLARLQGLPVPDDEPPWIRLRGVLDEMRCGLETGDWDSVAEGYDRLERFVMTLAGGAAAPTAHGRED